MDGFSNERGQGCHENVPRSSVSGNCSEISRKLCCSKSGKSRCEGDSLENVEIRSAKEGRLVTIKPRIGREYSLTESTE